MSFYGLSSGRRNSLAVVAEFSCSFCFFATMAGIAAPPGLPISGINDADGQKRKSSESDDSDGSGDVGAKSVA